MSTIQQLLKKTNLPVEGQIVRIKPIFLGFQIETDDGHKIMIRKNFRIIWISGHNFRSLKEGPVAVTKGIRYSCFSDDEEILDIFDSIMVVAQAQNINL